MNNTPTPWTDANEEDGWNPCGWAVDSNLVRELERELAAVTEQRDGLTKTCWALWFNELLRLASIKGITTSDDADCWWDDFNNGKTPQESMNEFLDSDEGLAFRDNCKQNDESSQLALVTEQRDRLAEAMQTIICIYEKPDKGCIPCSSDMYDVALQSLNQDHSVDSNDMIANQPTKP